MSRENNSVSIIDESLEVCELCDSIDIWQTPAGATVCRSCRAVSKPAEEVVDPLFEVDWWRQTSIEERWEMLRPKVRHPCLCCKGITLHNRHCADLQKEWYRMPWGKYRDHSVQSIPRSYLEFVASRRYGTEEDQDMIRRELERRNAQKG